MKTWGLAVGMGSALCLGFGALVAQTSAPLPLFRHKNFLYTESVDPRINMSFSSQWVLAFAATPDGPHWDPYAIVLRKDPNPLYDSITYRDELMPILFPLAVTGDAHWPSVTVDLKPSLLLHAPGSFVAPLKQKLKLVSRCPHGGPDCPLADLYLGSRLDYFPEGHENEPHALVWTVVVSDIEQKPVLKWKLDPYLLDARDDVTEELDFSRWVWVKNENPAFATLDASTPGTLRFAFRPRAFGAGKNVREDYVMPLGSFREPRDSALHVVYVDYGIVREGDPLNKSFKVYRGYSPRDPGYGDAAVRGVAVPGNVTSGHRDPVLHTVDSNSSVFISTSASPDVARRVAGDDGVVLEFVVTANSPLVHATVAPTMMGMGRSYPPPPDEDRHYRDQILLEGEWTASVVYRPPFEGLPSEY